MRDGGVRQQATLLRVWDNILAKDTPERYDPYEAPPLADAPSIFAPSRSIVTTNSLPAKNGIKLIRTDQDLLSKISRGGDNARI